MCSETEEGTSNGRPVHSVLVCQSCPSRPGPALAVNRPLLPTEGGALAGSAGRGYGEGPERFGVAGGVYRKCEEYK